MTRASSRPSRAAILLSLVALLAIPVQTALAAPRGSQVSATIEPLMSVVSVGEITAFEAMITNGGSANIANLRFDGIASGGTFVSATSPCIGGGEQVNCALPNLNGGMSLTLRFLFTAPDGAGDLDFVGAFSAEGQRSNPGGSRDTWPAAASLEVSDSADLFSRWQQAHGSLTFPTVGASGTQVTTVSVPPVTTDYPALVAQGDDEIECNGTSIEGVGQAVRLAIAGGDSPVNVTIAYPKDELSGVTPSKIEVVHQLDDGTCEFPPRGCKDNGGFCYDAKWSGSQSKKQLILRVELPSNGLVKGI